MSDMTTNLDLIQQSQQQKEVTANAYFDASSQAATYGRRASTTLGLTWGYYGGNVKITATTRTRVNNGTVALTASATHYIEADPTSGAVTRNSTAFTAGKIPLYKVTCGSSGVTAYEDWRIFPLAAV